MGLRLERKIGSKKGRNSLNEFQRGGRGRGNRNGNVWGEEEKKEGKKEGKEIYGMLEERWEERPGNDERGD